MENWRGVYGDKAHVISIIEMVDVLTSGGGIGYYDSLMKHDC